MGHPVGEKGAGLLRRNVRRRAHQIVEAVRIGPPDVARQAALPA